MDTPIKKICVLYGNNSFAPEQIANNFDILVCDFHDSYSTWYFDIAEKINQVKALNPNIKIFGYILPVLAIPNKKVWETIGQHEAWFVHNSLGERIVYGNYYLMDLRNSAYQAYLLSWLNMKLTEAAFDGFFMDGASSHLAIITGGADSSVPADYITGFHSMILGFLQYAKASFPGLIMINSEEGVSWQYETHDYIQVVDAQFIEGLGFKSWEQTPNSPFTNTKMMETIEYIGGLNKIVGVVGGSIGATAEVKRFALSLFLLSAQDNAYFNLGPNTSDVYDQITLDPLLNELNIGSSIGNRVGLTRTFTNGSVTADLDTASSTITINEPPPPTCPNGQHWDETLQACVDDVIPPPPKPCALASATQGTAFVGILPILRLWRDKQLPQKAIRDYYFISKFLAPKIDRLRRCRK